MGLKIFLSKRSIEILDNCVEEFTMWHFDAINTPLLLEQLDLERESCLHDYLLSEGIDDEDDTDVMIPTLVGERQESIRIEEVEEEKDIEEIGPKVKDKKEKEPKYKSEYFADIEYMDEDGEKHKYPVAEEVFKIFEKLTQICKEHKIECVRPIHILAAMFAIDEPLLMTLFVSLNINYKMAKDYFAGEEAFVENVIPYSLSGFMSCLNGKVNVKKPCEILMRDKEVNQIWNISLKKNKRNTIIVGEAGVGKSALIEKITYEIVKGTCPDRFKDFFVISLDVNSLIAGTKFRGQSEERIKELIEFLQEHNNVILFIDEVHTILGAGSCFEGEMDLANALKPILARGDTIVIGATTEDEYQRYFKKDAALARRFEKVVVEEPLTKDVYPMIKNKIRVLSSFHTVRISKAMAEFAIMIANCFAFDKKNPDKTLDLIDRSMVAAYRKGKKSVDKESILENFDCYFEMYEGMGDEAHKEIAYHEAGHYIVGKISDKLIELNMLAVSIMPAEDYLGVTCYEILQDRIPFKNKAYYIDLLAFYLGGRVAEKVFRGDETSGASEDLNNATKVAFDVITKFGMSSQTDIKRNNIFLNTPDYPMFSEKSVDLINREVEAIINEAYDRALSIIEENKGLLKLLVKKLMERKIMSEKELDKVFKQYARKRK